MLVALVVGAVAALPTTLLAQQWPPPPPPAKNTDRLPWSHTQPFPVSPTPQPAAPQAEKPAPAQAEHAPQQRAAPRPAAAPLPRPAPPRRKAADAEKFEQPSKPKSKPKSKSESKPEPRPAPEHARRHRATHTAHTNTVACRGVFAKDSNSVRLSGVFKAQNVAFTKVNSADGTKVMASVLFPKDPSRRLEVWWSNQDAREGIYLIVINHHSTWVAPRGVKLGLDLAALEKINRKPFKLEGLDSKGSSRVSDWNGGALARLPGGCKIGMRLQADAKVDAKLRAAASGEHAFASSDAAIRAVKPRAAEIIIGY
jgi:hypothetical protein